MEPRVSLVTLGVRDLQRALASYCDGLGWPVSSASTDEVAFLRTGSVALVLWPHDLLAADARLSPEGSGFGGMALAHNVRTRDEVDAVLEQVAGLGATILKPAEDAEWGGRSGYFADPDGHPWKVAWNPGFPIGPDGSRQLP